jgi:hypothetical protein
MEDAVVLRAAGRNGREGRGEDRDEKALSRDHDRLPRRGTAPFIQMSRSVSRYRGSGIGSSRISITCCRKT